MRLFKPFTLSVALCLVAGTVVGQAPEWNVLNYRSYEYSMNITGLVYLTGTESTDENDRIGAFAGEECVGVASLEKGENSEKFFGFLTIFSNKASGQSISLKVYDASEDSVHMLDTLIDFQAEAIIGNPAAPYLFASPRLKEEADWVSFSIMNLQSTVAIEPTKKIITIATFSPVSLDSLVVDFEVSEGAKVLVNGLEQISGVTPNNFSDSVLYEIQAQNPNYSQSWTVKVDIASQVLGVPANQNIRVFPNPTSGTVTLRRPNKEAWVLFNLQGIQLATGTDDYIAMDAYPGGLYLLLIRNETVRIIKE
ncbi:MAG: T9SS type A sorting domain-containing protein [Imperialibacter sp.]|uniref:T9SS type A sorting domain-containing protein n=1 Tax=Imperialibacter sp. TaxID=2038411 RepID=UPI0032EBF235